MGTAAAAPTPGERVRDARVVVLAINSGATDAIGFLALGGAFTSVMTGNMVLLGLSAGARDGRLAVHIAAAIVCYMAGTAVGSRVAGQPSPDGQMWPREITRALVVEAAVLAGYAIGWESAGGRPGGTLQIGLLMTNAIALGIQSATIQRFGIAGLSTTYLTGTLTTVIAHIASGKPAREVTRSVWILGGLIGGAALGGTLVLQAPPLVPLIQLASVGGVIVSATLLGGGTSGTDAA